VVVPDPKSSHITTTLRSLYWLKITEGIEYKLLSCHLLAKSSEGEPLYIYICMTSSLFNRLSALAFYLLLPLLGRQHYPDYEL